MSPQERRRTRKLLVQALYSKELSQTSFSLIKEWVIANNQHIKYDCQYLNDILDAMANCLQSIDDIFSPFINRTLADVNPVELSILRLSSYEMTYRLDIPYKVVINEALELAKIFGATDGHKFVNGVLDKVAQNIRSQEMVA